MRVVPVGSATVASPGMGTAAYRRSSASSSRSLRPAVHGMRIILTILDAFISGRFYGRCRHRPDAANPDPFRSGAAADRWGPGELAAADHSARPPEPKATAT